jgi:hypothetical protein
MNQSEKKRMEQNWLAMRNILDKEMPTANQRRVILAPWWLQYGIAAVSIGVLFFSLRQIFHFGSLPQDSALVIDSPTSVKNKKAETSNITPELKITEQNRYFPKQNRLNTIEGNQTRSDSKAKMLKTLSEDQLSTLNNLPNHRSGTQFRLTNEATISEAHSIALPSEFVASTGQLSTKLAVSEQLLPEFTEKTEFSAHQMKGAIAPIATNGISELDIAEIEIEMTPFTKALQVPKVRFGMQAQAGSSLLPLPSSLSLSLITQIRLKNSFSILTGIGLDKLKNIKNTGEIVEISSQELQDHQFAPTVADYLRNNSSVGNFPRLKSAHFWSVFGQVHKNFSTRFVAGAGLKFQTLANAKLSTNNSEIKGSFISLPLATDLEHAYAELAEAHFAKNSLAIQAQVQYVLSNQIRVGLMTQNVVTRNHPEPTSIHLSFTYLLR